MSINITIQNGQPQGIDVDVTDLNVPRVVTRGFMHPLAQKTVAIRQDDLDGLGDIEVRYANGRVERHRNLRANQIVTL